MLVKIALEAIECNSWCRLQCRVEVTYVEDFLMLQQLSLKKYCFNDIEKPSVQF